MNLLSICGTILITIAIIEIILSGTWNKMYFSYGIPILSKEIEFSNTDKTSTEILYFINHMDTVKGFSKYTGRIFDENTFAFRKKMFTVSIIHKDYKNIHGTIIIDPETRTLKIQCFARYTFIAFLIDYFIYFMDHSESVFISAIINLIIIFIFSLIYYLYDRSKFNELYSEISKLIV